MLGFHSISEAPISALVGGVVPPPVVIKPSAPTRLARYASYRQDGSAFIRQIAPGIYLRAGSEELLPNVIVGQQEVGSAEVLSAKGNPLAKQILGDRVTRKIRRELRRIRDTETRLAEQERLLRQSNAALQQMEAKIRSKLEWEAADEEDVEFILLNL